VLVLTVHGLTLEFSEQSMKRQLLTDTKEGSARYRIIIIIILLLRQLAAQAHT